MNGIYYVVINAVLQLPESCYVVINAVLQLLTTCTKVPKVLHYAWTTSSLMDWYNFTRMNGAGRNHTFQGLKSCLPTVTRLDLLVVFEEYVQTLEPLRHGLLCEEVQFRTAICSLRETNLDVLIQPRLHRLMHHFTQTLVRGPLTDCTK